MFELHLKAERELYMIHNTKKSSKSQYWILFVDGSSNYRGSGMGIVRTSPEGNLIERDVQYELKITNN